MASEPLTEDELTEALWLSQPPPGHTGPDPTLVEEYVPRMVAEIRAARERLHAIERARADRGLLWRSLRQHRGVPIAADFSLAGLMLSPTDRGLGRWLFGVALGCIFWVPVLTTAWAQRRAHGGIDE